MTLPRKLKIFEGRRGQAGSNGSDGLGSGNIRQGIINNPLSSVLNINDESKILNGSLSVTRGTEATFTDRYDLVCSPAGLTNTNLFTYSQDLSQWTLTDLTLESSTETDPFGGNTATRFSADTSGLKGLQLTTTINDDSYYTVSFWIRSDVGDVDSVGVFGNFGFSRSIPYTITSEFQRIEFYFVGADVTELGISISSDAGVEFIITGLMVQEGTRATDYIFTNGSQVTKESLGSILRSNKSGFFTEGAGENLLVYTENFVTKWSITGGTISDYSGVDPFGNTGKSVNIKSLSSDTTDLKNIADVSYISGQTYTVSFYGKVLGGSVSSLLVSIAGGDFVSFGSLSTSDFERKSVNVIAGDQNNEVIFRVVSSVSNADLVITGVQVELGNRLTSYIRSAATPSSRDGELVSIDAYNNVTSPSDDFSFLCNISNYSTLGENFYIFDNGKTGVNNFSCWIDDDNLYIRNQVETISYTWSNTNTRLAIVNEAGVISVYADGSLVSSQSFIGALVSVSSSMVYLSDVNGDNSFYGYSYDFRWYATALNADEIKYIHGSSI